MAKFCTECGYRLDDDASFCVNCGAPSFPVEFGSADPQPDAAPTSGGELFSYSAESRYANAHSPASPEDAGAWKGIAAYPPEPTPQEPDPYQPDPISERPVTYEDDYQYMDDWDDAAPREAKPAPAPKKKKDLTGWIIALSIAALLLTVTAFVLIFVWHPFGDDGSDGQSAGSTASDAVQDATLPSGAPFTQAPDETVPVLPTQGPTQAPTQEPTQEPTQAPTQEPTQAPTQAPTQGPTQEPTQPPSGTTDGLTASDRTEIQQRLTKIIEYGYSSSKLDVAKYLDLTFVYHYCLDDSVRQDVYTESAERITDRVETYEFQYGSGYTASATVSGTDVLDDVSRQAALESFGDEYDVSGVEKVVVVSARVTFSGSRDTDTENMQFAFFRVDGKWYIVF